MTVLTNDELIKLRSRLFRGYRAPLATTNMLGAEQLVSVTRDGSGNVQQMVHRIDMLDGTTITRTIDYILDGTGNVMGSTESYAYETTNPTP